MLYRICTDTGLTPSVFMRKVALILPSAFLRMEAGPSPPAFDSVAHAH
jgi:hypothetical protein